MFHKLGNLFTKESANLIQWYIQFHIDILYHYHSYYQLTQLYNRKMSVLTHQHHLTPLLIRKYRFYIVVLVDLQTKNRTFDCVNKNYTLLIVCHDQSSIFWRSHYLRNSLRQINISSHRNKCLFLRRFQLKSSHESFLCQTK